MDTAAKAVVRTTKIQDWKNGNRPRSRPVRLAVVYTLTYSINRRPRHSTHNRQQSAVTAQRQARRRDLPFSSASRTHDTDTHTVPHAPHTHHTLSLTRLAPALTGATRRHVTTPPRQASHYAQTHLSAPHTCTPKQGKFNTGTSSARWGDAPRRHDGQCTAADARFNPTQGSECA